MANGGEWLDDLGRFTPPALQAFGECYYRLASADLRACADQDLLAVRRVLRAPGVSDVDVIGAAELPRTVALALPDDRWTYCAKDHAFSEYPSLTSTDGLVVAVLVVDEGAVQVLMATAPGEQHERVAEIEVGRLSLAGTVIEALRLAGRGADEERIEAIIRTAQIAGDFQEIEARRVLALPPIPNVPPVAPVPPVEPVPPLRPGKRQRQVYEDARLLGELIAAATPLLALGDVEDMTHAKARAYDAALGRLRTFAEEAAEVFDEAYLAEDGDA